MALIPKYTITACCGGTISTGTFNIPGATLPGSDLYSFNGPSFIEPITGMEFYAGYCYEILYLGLDASPQPIAFNSSDITLIPDAKNCAGGSGACPDCDFAVPPAFEFSPCCDRAVTISLNVDASSCVILGNVWTYTGPGFITASGFEFLTGTCFHVTALLNGIYESGPACEDFHYSTALTCTEAEVLTDCPACNLSLEYLSFRTCCTPVTSILFKGVQASDYYGIREYLGLPIDGLENTCYSISYFPIGDVLVPDVAAYNLLPEAPIYTEGVTFSTVSVFTTNCAEIKLTDCPSCNTPCYTLYGCDGQIFNTVIDLSANVGTFITIADLEGNVPGTWFVTENTGECDNAVDDIYVVLPNAPACNSICYEVTGPSKITYLDQDLNIVTEIGPLKFCSYVFPQVEGSYPVNIYGNCTLVDGVLDCPQLCFTLTNCVTEEVYNSNTQSLSLYIGQTITMNGYDGCWVVSLNEGICDCPINVTVLTSFANCTECLPVIAYKFINCTNSAQVQYSDLDYSAYVGKTVELACGQCWIVEQINYTPPSIQIITILYTFDNCVDCARTYYKLTDCNGVENDVYTYTDLSSYLQRGVVISIKGCEGCWSITEVRDIVSTAVIVIVELSYTDCITCSNTAPCICSTIRNDGTIAVAFEYTDCFGEVQLTPLIEPGDTSLRYCLRSWQQGLELTNYVKYFGDCVDGICPPVVYPKRTIKPGYSTPTCDIEKYEQISCKSAQALYRQVLTLRYGISNCCPEEDEYWFVKKELIDIAALYNPAFPCAVSSCGCNSNCGGSCNTCSTCNS